MNNKTYGWHCFIGKGKEEQDFLFINGKGASKPDANWDKVIPLYTHPAKELTLSPDEIFDIWDEHTDYDGNFVTSVDDFVFAILRKAQEKC